MPVRARGGSPQASGAVDRSVQMNSTKTSYSRLALAVSGILAAAVAGAAPAVDAGRLEEVVVTAQRRAESAQDVGISLSVLSADSLRDAGVESVNDLQHATPSLEVEPAFGSGQAQFRLRGVGFIDYTSNNSSPVGVSVDGVALPFPIQTQGQVFDVSRVEVLRGPQGTLYGRNTTGGAINFISNRPTRDLHAGIDVEFGSHNALVTEAFLSGPLGESLSGRLAVAAEQGGAWQRNRVTGQELGDKDKLAARAQLLWTVSDGTDVRLSLHSSKDKSDAYGLQLFSPFTPAPRDAEGVPLFPTLPADTSPYATGWSLRPAFAQAVGISPNAKPGVNNTNNGASLDVNVDLGAATLTSITAYNKLTRRELNDWDATSYYESDVYFQSDAKSFSQEVRVASRQGSSLDWLAGVYYADDKLHEQFNNDFAQRLLGAARTEYGQSGKTIGVFEQTNYKFTDKLKGILGLRYEHETRELDGLTTLFAVGDPPNFADVASASNPTGLTFNLSGGAQSRSLSNSDLSGKIGLEYQIAQHSLGYVSISRGTKSGGFTAHNTLTPGAVDPFKPEKLTSFEVGVKSDFSDKLRLNAAAFHYEYRDQQILSKIFDPVSQSFVGRFINAPKSRIDGVEVELEWHPVQGLDISQYVGYKKGKFTATILNSSDVDFNGQDIDFPKTSYGGQVAYTLPVGGYQLRAETNYSYRDKYPQLFLLGPVFTNDSYWLANASVTLSPQSAADWSVSVWVRNLTNQKYYLTKNFFLPDTNVAAAGEPTTVGVRLKWAF
jgi:iron complex outermembrane recepter protein